MKEHITLALLAKIAQTRDELAGEDKTHWSYQRGKLDGLEFALARLDDTEQEAVLLSKIFRGWLYKYSHRLDVQTRSQYKGFLKDAITEHERSA